jgi:hypothetical protein
MSLKAESQIVPFGAEGLILDTITSAVGLTHPSDNALGARDPSRVGHDEAAGLCRPSAPLRTEIRSGGPKIVEPGPCDGENWFTPILDLFRSDGAA